MNLFQKFPTRGVTSKWYVAMAIVVIVFYGSLLALRLTQGTKEVVRETKTETVDFQTLEKQIQERSKDPKYLENKFRAHPWLKWISTFFFSFAQLAILAGVVLNVRLVILWSRRQSWMQKTSPAFGSAWGMDEVVKFVVTFLFCLVILNIVIYVLSSRFAVQSDSNLFLVCHGLMVDLVVFGLVLCFTYFPSASRRTVWGFDSTGGFLQRIGRGLDVYFTSLPSFIGIILVVAFVASIFSYEPPAHPLVEVFMEEEARSPLLIFVSLFLACVLGPIVEEIFFRGFLYPAIRDRFGIAAGVIVSSAFFAIIHESLFAFFPIFFLGAVLAYLYEKERSLVPSIAMHITHNSVFIAYFFVIKSLFLDS